MPDDRALKDVIIPIPQWAARQPPPLSSYTVMGHEVDRMMLWHMTTTCIEMYSPHPIEEFVWRMEKAIEDSNLLQKVK